MQSPGTRPTPRRAPRGERLPIAAEWEKAPPCPCTSTASSAGSATATRRPAERGPGGIGAAKPGATGGGARARLRSMIEDIWESTAQPTSQLARLRALRRRRDTQRFFGSGYKVLHGRSGRSAAPRERRFRLGYGTCRLGRVAGRRIGSRADGLEGTQALVAGGASGLGAATARALAERGARWRSSTWTATAPRRWRRTSAATPWFRADVSNEAEVEGAVEGAVEEFGGLRFAVSCAGIGWAERRRPEAPPGSSRSRPCCA